MSKGFTENIDMESLGALASDVEDIAKLDVPKADSTEIKLFQGVLN